MNPPLEAIQAIRGRVAELPGAWSADDATVLAALNTPDRANPAPRATVPVPLTVARAMALVSPAARGHIYKGGNMDLFAGAVRDGDFAAVANLLALAAEVGDISVAEAQSIAAEAGRTQLDPAWPPLISWAVAVVGRPLDLSDVHDARRAEG